MARSVANTAPQIFHSGISINNRAIFDVRVIVRMLYSSFCLLCARRVWANTMVGDESILSARI